MNNKAIWLAEVQENCLEIILKQLVKSRLVIIYVFKDSEDRVNATYYEGHLNLFKHKLSKDLLQSSNLLIVSTVCVFCPY